MVSATVHRDSPPELWAQPSPYDRTPEERWQTSCGNFAANATTMHAYWTQQFGDWQRFEVPSALVTLAKEAAETWTGLVTEWERLRPDVKTPMSEDEYDRERQKIRDLYGDGFEDDDEQNAEVLTEDIADGDDWQAEHLEKQAQDNMERIRMHRYRSPEAVARGLRLPLDYAEALWKRLGKD